MNVSKLSETVSEREAWHATVYGVTKSQTWLSDKQQQWQWLLCVYIVSFKTRKFGQISNDISFQFWASLIQWFRSVQSLSCVWLLWPYGLQLARFHCPSPIPRASSNSCSSGRWCHPTISSSVIPFTSHLQSFPASGSFQMSQFFASGDLSIGVSASVSLLTMNTQDWYPLGRTGWISSQSKGLSRAFCNTTVQKHWFFGTQLSLWSNSYIHTWLLEKP